LQLHLLLSTQLPLLPMMMLLLLLAVTRVFFLEKRGSAEGETMLLPFGGLESL